MVEQAFRKLAICGLDELDRELAQVDAVLSIVDPGPQTERVRRMAGMPDTHRVLSLHDVITPHRLTLDERDAIQAEEGVVLPTADHVREVLMFGRQVPAGALLVHCAAGISRSTACALLLLTQRLGPANVTAAVDHVAHVRPFAMPNTYILQLGDALLGFRGSLVKAATKHFGALGDGYHQDVLPASERDRWRLDVEA